MPTNLNVAFTVKETESEGPGKRFAIWFQGCDLACPDCCNPEMWSKEGGVPKNIQDILKEINLSKDIEGVSLLGGEPLQQDEALWMLAKEIQSLGLSVMLYTGYTEKEIKTHNFKTPKYCDLIVSGRYNKGLHTTKRRWIGSTNQKLTFVTNFYQKDDPCFSEPNSAEIRINSKGVVTVVGFPFESVRKNFNKKIEV